MDNNSYLDMSLLRFTTAGSVDDGKSTLIGRLLYDSKSIFEDQLSAIKETSTKRGEDNVDLALLTDGLRAEREQGITIDVAYRYFATPKRKFIIADTPGHIQYTRNMVTGASTANLAIILIDARHGVLEQTLRHTYIAYLLKMPNVVFCINKMDLVDFDEKIYNSIKKELEELSKKLNIKDAKHIPISAKFGDNVVNDSKNTPWYNGGSLLAYLETVKIRKEDTANTPRFPVQYVIRPQRKEFVDYRAYAGRVAGGTFKPGDEIMALPSQQTSIISAIDFCKDEVEQIDINQSASIQLKTDIDISRGDMIVPVNMLPKSSNTLTMDVCWFSEKPLNTSRKYIVRHTNSEMKCMIKNINYKTNINSYEHDNEDKDIKMNDIANISIITTQEVYYDSYANNRITGSLVLIDEATNETVAAGMIN